MTGIHRHIALLLASVVFIISFTFKYVFDIISIKYMVRDFIMFFGIYWVSNLILSRVEQVFTLSKKVMNG